MPATTLAAEAPATGMLTSLFGYEHRTAAGSRVVPAQDAFVGQLGYARRSLPSGLFVGGSLDFLFASSPVGTARSSRSIGLALHAGWDVGAATDVLLDCYVAPTWGFAGDDAAGRGPGILGGATLAVPWTSKTFVSLGTSAGKDDGVKVLLAFALVLLPNSIGARLERLAGDGRVRFGALFGWSIPLPL